MTKTPRSRLGITLCTVALALLVVDDSGLSATGPVLSLSVEGAPVPALRVAGYPGLVTNAVYPRVFRPGFQLEAVNQGLRTAVVAEEQRFARFLRSYEPRVPKLDRQTLHGGFETSLKPSLLSASTVVVSALIPDTECVPGCTGADFWFSVTVRVPSGDVITLPRLFANRRSGLRALANFAERQVLASNRCIRPYFEPTGFTPTWKNYQSFALTASGIAVGFGTSQVGLPGCGRVSTIVPYSVIAPYFSGLGKQLVAGVRAAT